MSSRRCLICGNDLSPFRGFYHCETCSADICVRCMIPCVQRGFTPSYGSCRNTACGAQFAENNYIYPLSSWQKLFLFLILLTWTISILTVNIQDPNYIWIISRLTFSWFPLESIIFQPEHVVSMWCIFGIFFAMGAAFVFTLGNSKPYHPLWLKWWLLFTIFNILTADIDMFDKLRVTAFEQIFYEQETVIL
jgi:hypothetical protein